VREVLLLDVTPLTLGIETLGGVATPIIPRNTTIPTSKSQTFSTASDSQTSVEIHVLQGERGMAMDNKSLGRFILDGILPAPRGMPQIESPSTSTPTASSRLRPRQGHGPRAEDHDPGGHRPQREEIEKMKRDAEAHAEEDRKRREEVEVRNQADTLAYTAEKTVNEAGDKIPPDIRAEIESGVKDVRDAAAAESGADNIRAAMTRLSESMQKAGSAVYGAAGEEGGPIPEGEPEGEAPAEEGTVEGEYREV
jgi:molecular chaperone DnaK